ncbi:uncharacterized protein LOC120423247 [Culex pipiens pallens]|uniref:uncharacterized protein LOC120423247 n=1 Tax=Culex pipiens pallens TaxID=42434 RepID=UPI0019530D25|nr:uncharacterized protein LOC120423247 [Culex pipiens pallens]
MVFKQFLFYFLSQSPSTTLSEIFIVHNSSTTTNNIIIMDQIWETKSSSSSSSSGLFSNTTSSSPALSPSSDDGSSPLGFLSLQNSILAKELEKLPTTFMLNVLEEMSHQPELVHLQLEVLSNPVNVSKILHTEPCGREKMLKFFLILEKSNAGFVWNLTEQYQAVMALLPNLPDGHLLGFSNNLELGSFLVETGWYAEASVILSLARRQAGSRPLELLKTLRVALVAESLASRYEEASQTIADIAALIKHAKNVPMTLTAGLHHSLSVCFFEESDFEGSYQHGVMALQLLDDSINCSYETIVGTFRQLAKTCLAMKRPGQARLLITQAVSWSRHHFGAVSVPYAEALEDFAFYLLAVNAYRDCLKIESEVKDVYFNLFGHLCLQPELAQGNLAFRLYLESYGYKNIGSIDQYMDYVLDLDRGRSERRNGTDDRQMLAIKRIPAMMAVTNAAHEEMLTSKEFEEALESIRAPPLMLDDVRKLFFTKFA